MEVNTTNPRQPGCSILLKSCLVITALVIALFMIGLVYMMRMGSVRSVATCADNMQQVAAAIQRYADVNGHRPAEVGELRKEYLSRPSLLRCPLDTTPGDASSYDYNPKAKGRQVMLQCNRHRIRKDMPVSKLIVRGDGTFEMVRPSIRDTIKEAEKHAREK